MSTNGVEDTKAVSGYDGCKPRYPLRHHAPALIYLTDGAPRIPDTGSTNHVLLINSYAFFYSVALFTALMPLDIISLTNFSPCPQANEWKDTKANGPGF